MKAFVAVALGASVATGALLVFAVLVALIVGLPVMLLWNWVMPALFGVAEISFLRAIGLVLLCELLFQTSPKLNKET